MSVLEVDSTAYCDKGITFCGTETHDGVVAVPDPVQCGTQFKILSGPLTGKVVTVEDRVVSGSQFDIWMEDCDAAIQYGRQRIQIQQLDDGDGNGGN
jgi:3D (Asp-Asp-Asp) domain-containing protein